jgi:general stress protein 26
MADKQFKVQKDKEIERGNRSNRISIYLAEATEQEYLELNKDITIKKDRSCFQM